MTNYPLLDKAFVINLDARKDRLDICYPEFKRVVLDVERFSAISVDEKDYLGNSGQRGCALSHFSIWEKVKKERYGACLILEDDVVFHENFKEELNNVLSYVKDLVWDIIYLYNNNNSDFIDVGKPVFRIPRGQWCTHAYLVSSSFVEKILPRKEEFLRHGSAIDRWLKHSIKDLAKYSTSVYLAKQHLSLSDISAGKTCGGPQGVPSFK